MYTSPDPIVIEHVYNAQLYCITHRLTPTNAAYVRYLFEIKNTSNMFL